MAIAPAQTGSSTSPVVRGMGDMHLKITGEKQGKIKGESNAKGCEGDIVIHTWNFSLTLPLAGDGSTSVTGRRSYTELTVTKSHDMASTALLVSAATNETLKEVKLTMRKALGGQEDYFFVTLTNARVSRITHDVSKDGGVLETVAFGFFKIDVEYKQQLTGGARGGAFMFSDELFSVS